MACIRGSSALLLVFAAGLLAAESRLCPPLWVDRDDRPIKQPKKREASELYAIAHNSWLRHLDVEYKALKAADKGALNVNAWDEVPDSTWFTNRLGRKPLSLADIAGSLAGKNPGPVPWRIMGTTDEGYTPKLRIQDADGGRYMLKFDLPAVLERNSGAERISTLILHAAGYNVPHNSIAYFRAADLLLDKDSQYKQLRLKRPMTPADLEAMLRKLKPLAGGRYRGLASCFVNGADLGKFIYSGRRKDDPNDLIPHELRRELRGLRVIASWINHVDVGDKNAMDVYWKAGDGRQYVKHYLLDFGSTLGSGDFVNGPYRVGHEYIFDGPSMGKAFLTLGVWRRPWETRGKILYPEVGYFDAGLFEPRAWRPNYPNLAFERMDDGDAYWGAKIVTAFSGELIRGIVEAGEYSRPEVTAHVAEALLRRRDIIGRYWLDRITPLEEFVLDGAHLRFRDLAVERGYADAPAYRLIAGGRITLCAPRCEIPELSRENAAATPDRYGRVVLQRVRIQSSRRDGGWALPVEVVIGKIGGSGGLEVLGWQHAPR